MMHELKQETAMWILLALAVAAFILLQLSGCSIYRVKHGEIYDGEGRLAGMETSLIELVPPGGKKLATGKALIQSEDWLIDLSSETDTDAQGTSDLIEHMFEAAIRAGMKASAPVP